MRFDPKVKPEVFASKDQTRPHLTRVFLDKENGVMAATDGHRLIVTPVADLDSGDDTGPIEPEVLAAARKATRQHGNVFSANGHCTLANGVIHMRPKYAEGDAFPPYKQVIPTRESEIRAVIAVNPEYLADIAKATGARSVTLEIRGELDPIVARTQGELGETTIVIMPMRR